MFSKAKFILKEITKEEYEKANGINVFLDGTTIQLQKDDRYLSIEFYLYSVETKQYEPVTLTSFEYEGGTPHIYNCNVYLKVNDRIYTSDWSSFQFNITTDGRAFATLRLKEQETGIDMLFDAEFYI